MTEPTSGDDDAQAAEWRGLGDLVTLATDRLVAPVEGMHQAIADRWLGLSGRAGEPVRRGYRRATGQVYDAVRLTGAAVGSALGWGAAQVGSRARPLWSTASGTRIQANVNALWGDELARRDSTLGISLGLRTESGEVVDVEAVDEAVPAGTRRVAMLIHGLGETERSWNRDPGLADALGADGVAPLWLRYNTGRRVAENGAELAELLDRIVEHWPGELTEIVLIGHSMGGLVARSAMHEGVAAGHQWPDITGHLVAIGSPHLGAPLEKGANLVARALQLVPESRPLAEFLDFRSDGIKDLRFGSVVEADWHGIDPAALVAELGDAGSPGGIEQHFVAGVVTGEPTHPIGIAVGDLIVRVASGTGRGSRRTVAADNVRVFGGRRHFDLLGDEEVHEQVRAWVTPARPS